ncbi:MAG: hypothetical protein HAW63_03840 [Bdellovibrionaceae bacterium]|nr:hypothetical protein [Pseudobdellovibrionaceae bacterium]
MNKEQTFFVGYLALPKKYSRFLKLFLPFLFVALLVLSYVLSSYKNAPNKGKGWDPTGKTAITVKAWLLTKPYVLARFKHQSKVYTAILTAMDKRGIKNRVKGLHNQWVKLTGIMTHYEGRFVFNILDGKEAIVALKTKPTISKTIFKKSFGLKTLQGEVIDPKCYVGAMKPGLGKTHKACATLCIKGGIPPALLVQDQLFKERFYLLLDENGQAVLESILPFVGDQVQLQGEVQRWGDLWFYKMKKNSIKRINL